MRLPVDTESRRGGYKNSNERWNNTDTQILRQETRTRQWNYETPWAEMEIDFRSKITPFSIFRDGRNILTGEE